MMTSCTDNYNTCSKQAKKLCIVKAQCKKKLSQLEKQPLPLDHFKFEFFRGDIRNKLNR